MVSVLSALRGVSNFGLKKCERSSPAGARSR